MAVLMLVGLPVWAVEPQAMRYHGEVVAPSCLLQGGVGEEHLGLLECKPYRPRNAANPAYPWVEEQEGRHYGYEVAGRLSHGAWVINYWVDEGGSAERTGVMIVQITGDVAKREWITMGDRCHGGHVRTALADDSIWVLSYATPDDVLKDGLEETKLAASDAPDAIPRYRSPKGRDVPQHLASSAFSQCGAMVLERWTQHQQRWEAEEISLTLHHALAEDVLTDGARFALEICYDRLVKDYVKKHGAVVLLADPKERKQLGQEFVRRCIDGE